MLLRFRNLGFLRNSGPFNTKSIDRVQLNSALRKRVGASAFYNEIERQQYSTISSQSYTTRKNNENRSGRLHNHFRYSSFMPGNGSSNDKSKQMKKSNNDEPDDEQPDNNKPAPRSRAGMLVSLGIGASFLFGKMKFVLIGLKLTKAAPLISMLITSATYSLFFGWPYAIGMVGLIFVHECGHAVVMRHYGVPFSPMVFIPFMGAVISMKERPKNSYEEAIIAFGGPVLGSAAALSLAGIGAVTENQLLLALADWGLMINLFNLLPIGSLDGGRICSAVTPYIGVAGLLGGGAMIFYGVVHNPIFYLIMMAGTYSTTSRFMGWDEEETEDYYRIKSEDQGILFGSYLALIASLIGAMQVNDRYRKTPKQLQHEKASPWETTEAWKHNGDGVYDDVFGDTDSFSLEYGNDDRGRL